MNLNFNSWRKFLRTGLVVVLAAFVILCTVVYWRDARAIRDGRVHEYRTEHSGLLNPAEAEVGANVFPVSEYLIEIGELKGVDHFESAIRLNDLQFLHPDGKQYGSLPNETPCELSQILLRFYKNTSETSSAGYPEVVDTVLEPFAGPAVRCFGLRGDTLKRRPSIKYGWAVVHGTPERYPFDEYTLRLEPEEQVDYTGTVTNSPPELIKVTANDPRYNISSFAVDKGVALVTLRRSSFLRVLALFLLAVLLGFVVYLTTIKSNTQLLPSILGYVAGVWGIRSIISTSAPLFPTVTDYVALVLLGLVVWIALWKLTRPNQPAETASK